MKSERRAGGTCRRKVDLEVLAAAFGAQAALDQLNQGIALIDRIRRVQFANRRAHAICEETDGLRLEGRELIATAAADAARLDMAMRRVLTDKRGAILRLARTSGRRPLAVSISSLASADAALGAAMPAVLVLIMDPDRCVELAPEHLIQAYDLTPAEARVTQLLVQGSEIDGIAHKLGIRRETARTHLRRVLAKTRTHRQSELIRQLLSEVSWTL